MKNITRPNFALEVARIWPVAGVDEVGRGPLAGPVLAAAVILNPMSIPDGLADSKVLTRSNREFLDIALRKSGAHISLGAASVPEIDKLNILSATLLAMKRAIASLTILPGSVIIDGSHAPALPYPTSTVKGGDSRSLSIAAASIIAKVARDRLMIRLADRYPIYGWNKNAGYATAAHRTVLKEYGPSPHHRMSFAPLRTHDSETV
tara:strand:+ start:122 stop:739 length:618 start_codon:yes stop_codon:yes gene_type:complete